MLATFAGALSWSCRGSDQIAPDGATIELAANPTTIVLLGGAGSSGSSDIIATVSSSVGVPLKDQDVRFSSSAGSLFTPGGDPGANIPIRTDDLGNAHVTLVTTKTTTVNARSGTATGSLTLDTVAGNISSILLNQDTATAGCITDPTFQTCSDSFCLVAQVIDDEGLGIAGVAVSFSVQNAENSVGKPVTGVFTPTQVTTDAGGLARAKFRLGSNCPDVCGGGAETCSGELSASLQGGGFPSTPVTFSTAIP
jgi:hypothetical protein